MIELLRAELQKTNRQDREEASKFEVGSGIAFLSALMTQTNVTIMPRFLRDPMCHSCDVAQSTAGYGRFSLHHVTSALTCVGAVRSYKVHPSASDNQDITCDEETNLQYVWLRNVTFLPLICQPRPPVTATYTAILKELETPLHAVDWTSHPLFTDFGSLAFLTKLLARTMDSWLEDAALIRLLLLAECLLPVDHYKADPIWAKLAMDGNLSHLERVPNNNISGAFSIREVPCMAVALDTWVGLTDGLYRINGWSPYHSDIAVIPIDTRITAGVSIWIYLASFISTRLWNGMYLLEGFMRPNEHLATSSELNMIKFKVRPRAGQVVVDGPHKILLVVTNVTSRLELTSINVNNTDIPMWRQGAPSEPRTTDICSQLRKNIGIEGNISTAQSHWHHAWDLLTHRISTEASIQRALYIAAEASRTIDYGICSNPDATWSIHSINMESCHLPSLPGVNINIVKWADKTVNVAAELQSIELENISPHGQKPHYWCTYKLDSATNKIDLSAAETTEGTDWSITCYEASPAMRIARFMGLIDMGTNITFGHQAAVSELISATAYMQLIGVSWIQATAGVTWTTWALGEQESSFAQVDHALDEMLRSAVDKHVIRSRPDEQWAKLVKEKHGMDGNSASTIISWWAMKSVLQQLGYIIPATVSSACRSIASKREIGYLFERTSEWQTLMRMTSRLCVETPFDAPVYAVTRATSPTLQVAYTHYNWLRFFATSGEEQYNRSKPYLNTKKSLDASGAVFCALSYLAHGHKPELLLLKTMNAPGLSCDMGVSVKWPDEWWNWLLGGVRTVSQCSFADCIPASFIRGAPKGFLAFLSGTGTTEQATQERGHTEERNAHETVLEQLRSKSSPEKDQKKVNDETIRGQD